MAADLNTIVKQLSDSGILAPGKLENFVPPKAHPQSVDELVAELVKHKELTTFQAAQVKAGKARALILGEYTIVDRIGAGGMGQVFKAVHRRMERVVAIKMLPPAMTKDAAAMARFQREVVAAAKLQHQNIVSAYDAGQAGPAHFLVMEYVDGKDLSAIVKQNGPLPVNKAINYILQAARGLEFAHSKGVIHRDIKPANLLLGSDGVVKILDMGLARVAGAAESGQMELTGSGMIMGTVDFMSPEQAIATKHADHRADVYSLGITLYYLLSGRMPYSGDTAIEKLMAHQTQPIPNLQDVQTTVPKQLDAVFKKMVAKKVEDRYQSMSEVIEALEELGIATSITKKSEVASTLALSPEQKKKLAATGKKNALSSITEKVASEKTRGLLVKVVGGTFGTLIAPLLVFYLIRYLEKKDEPAKPPVVENVAGTLRVRSPAKENSQNPRVDPLPVSAAQQVGNGTRTVPATLVAPFDAAQAKAGQDAWAKYLGTQVETINSVGMRLTLIPPGEFLMGSTPEQVAAARQMGEDDKLLPTNIYFGLLAEEMPQHKVTISQPFLIGSTEVTVAQFRKFVAASKYITEAEKDGFIAKAAKQAGKGWNWKNPGSSAPITDETAVTLITWNDACAYCAWLSEQEQRRAWYRADGRDSWLVAAHADGYRLPTEAEWEYACRAGTTTQFSCGDDKSQLEQYGWFLKNQRNGVAQPVALKLPNPFGLFDMHGNATEWCQDFGDGKWYDKSPPTDPIGPSSGTHRLIRGGSWPYGASFCRSAFRIYDSPSHRFVNSGFRIVRPLDAAAPETALATTAKPPLFPPGEGGRKPDEGARPWDTPAIRQWVADTQKLSAEKQIEAVSKKLMELNPGFDGKVTPRIANGIVVQLDFLPYQVTDLSPVRALSGLQRLRCDGAGSANRGRLRDLSPLAGLPLKQLTCGNTQVSDLSPLRGMKLDSLAIGHTNVLDLSPLAGMPLVNLDCIGTAVQDLSPLIGMPLKSLTLNNNSKLRDLSPLRGMQLTSLLCSGTPISDISALAGMPLTYLSCTNETTDFSPLAGMKLREIHFIPSKVARGLEIIRDMESLEKISPTGAGKDSLPAAEFWRKYEAGEFGKPAAAKKLAYRDPAFRQWVADTQKLPAQQQIEAVVKKLMELNPGFDGKLTDSGLKGTPTIEKGVVTSLGLVADRVVDISPVRALAGVTTLKFSGSSGHHSPLADLSPLAELRLTYLSCNGTNVADLSPLAGMPLQTLDCGQTPISDLVPLGGMPLTSLMLHQSSVTDLRPLAGSPLRILGLAFTRVSDVTPLETCSNLTSLSLAKTKVTAAGVAALQKALPDCKIEWDDPAKTATPATAPARKK